jgi:hypothetical protein
MSEIKFNILYILIFITIQSSLSSKIFNTLKIKDSKCTYFSNETFQKILNEDIENNKKTNSTLFIFFSSKLIEIKNFLIKKFFR